MRFVISSGTEIAERREHHTSADSALNSILDLVAKRRPNICIHDENGRALTLSGLWRLAALETVGARRPMEFPRTTFFSEARET